MITTNQMIKAVELAAWRLRGIGLTDSADRIAALLTGNKDDCEFLTWALYEVLKSERTQ